MTTDLNKLKEALSQGVDAEKVSALREMREGIFNGEPLSYFDLAKAHVGDDSNDVRWQSLIVIGEYIPFGQKNEDIWNLIIEYCGHDEDMQDALATVLLEHLLEHDFDHTFERIKKEFRKGTTQIVNLLERCWQFDQPKAKWHELQNAIQEFHADNIARDA